MKCFSKNRDFLSSLHYNLKDLLAAFGKDNQRQIMACRLVCLLSSASRAVPTMIHMSPFAKGGTLPVP